MNRHRGNDDQMPIKALSTFLQGLKRKSSANDMNTPPRKQPQQNYSNRYPKNELPDVWRCDACNVNCSSEMNLAQHKLGKRHAEACGLDAARSVSDRKKQLLTALGDQRSLIHVVRMAETGFQKFGCDVCPEVLMLEQDILLHVAGKKHKENLEERENSQKAAERKLAEAIKQQSASKKLSANSPIRNYGYSDDIDQSSAKGELNKLKSSLDQRELELEKREKEIAKKEIDLKKRAEVLSKREAELKIKEVQLLSLSFNSNPSKKNELLIEKLHERLEAGESEISSKLSQSEQRYYSQLLSQKKEVEAAYNNIANKNLLTIEERLAKSKLKDALENIQSSLTKLLKSKNVEVPKHISLISRASPKVSTSDANKSSNGAEKSPAIKSPEGNEISKDDLRKQMEKKLLEAMKGGTLAQLAKVIAKNPSMKAVLEKIEQKQGSDKLSCQDGAIKQNIEPCPSDRENIQKEFPVKKKPLLGDAPPKRKPTYKEHKIYAHHEPAYYQDDEYDYAEEFYEEQPVPQFQRPTRVARSEGLLPRPRRSGPLLPSPVPAPVPPPEKRKTIILPDVQKHGVRPHPSQVGVVPMSKKKQPLIGHAPQGYSSYY